MQIMVLMSFYNTSRRLQHKIYTNYDIFYNSVTNIQNTVANKQSQYQ
jgi:hypothetical protein